MENIDAEALAEANRSGSTIMYFAGVAQRWPNNTQTAATRTLNRTVATRQTPVARAPQNEETTDEAPPTAAPRPQARRNTRAANEGDTVRVGHL